jgi:hygromycin-B 4-O-kinase
LFGTLNSSGQAQFNSWRAFITNFSNWNQLIHKGANENFLDFEELFRTTFLDPMLFSKCKNAILELSPYCPEDKNYVHGDFGFGNLLIDGNKITGILDWAELLCGDFLVDIAALDYGRDTNSFSSFFEEFCRQESIPIPHFHERLRCYKIIMALKSMYLEANRNQPEWYDEEVGKLKKMGIG